MSIEALTLDQIRIFLTVAETGTFSAAAERLNRAQSAVSYAIANMEDQLQVQLFDRSTRRPTLTVAGQQVLADARAVDERLSDLKARARAIATGIEPKLSIAVEVLYPMGCLAKVLKTLSQEFPTLPITLHVETLGSTAQMLLAGQCDIAIVGPLIAGRHDIESIPLHPIKSVAVCAPDYLLAEQSKPLSKDDLHRANQLVLTDRSKSTEGQDFGVYSTSTWRLSDIGAKHELLKAGLGWGFMPHHLVKHDLENGALVQIRIAEMQSDHRSMGFAIAIRPNNPPGPGGRRFIELIKEVALS